MMRGHLDNINNTLTAHMWRVYSHNMPISARAAAVQTRAAAHYGAQRAAALGANSTDTDAAHTAVRISKCRYAHAQTALQKPQGLPRTSRRGVEE